MTAEIHELYSERKPMPTEQTIPEPIALTPRQQVELEVRVIETALAAANNSLDTLCRVSPSLLLGLSVEESLDGMVGKKGIAAFLCGWRRKASLVDQRLGLLGRLVDGARDHERRKR